MGWAIGVKGGRDIGYGVPALCDKPDCNKKIDRGLSYCCGGYISDSGCGLYFCQEHLEYRTPRGEDHMVELCPRCIRYRSPYEPKPDIPKWIRWKLKDSSWEQWRTENPEEVKRLQQSLAS